MAEKYTGIITGGLMKASDVERALDGKARISFGGFPS